MEGLENAWFFVSSTLSFYLKKLFQYLMSDPPSSLLTYKNVVANYGIRMGDISSLLFPSHRYSLGI